MTQWHAADDEREKRRLKRGENKGGESSEDWNTANQSGKRPYRILLRSLRLEKKKKRKARFRGKDEDVNPRAGSARRHVFLENRGPTNRFPSFSPPTRLCSADLCRKTGRQMSQLLPTCSKHPSRIRNSDRKGLGAKRRGSRKYLIREINSDSMTYRSRATASACLVTRK